MNKTIIKYKPYLTFLLFGIMLATAPLLQELDIIKYSTLTTLSSVLFYSIIALGLNILLGYSGLISLGSAGFMGLGAYISAYLTADLKLPFFVSLLIAICIPLILGIIIGLVSLRIEGHYLAIATLAVAEIFRKVFEEANKFTNGSSPKYAKYPNILNLYQLDRSQTYLLITIFLVIIMFLTYNLFNSATGRALLTMRGSEAAAQAMGINILKYRLIAFGIATVYASLAGVLYMHFIKVSTPGEWSLTLSLNILAVIVIGGLRSIYGTIIGTFIVFASPNLFIKPIFGDIYGLSSVITGLLIILVIMFYPNGAVSIGTDIKKGLIKLKNYIFKSNVKGVNS